MNPHIDPQIPPLTRIDHEAFARALKRLSGGIYTVSARSDLDLDLLEEAQRSSIAMPYSVIQRIQQAFDAPPPDLVLKEEN